VNAGEHIKTEIVKKRVEQKSAEAGDENGKSCGGQIDVDEKDDAKNNDALQRQEWHQANQEAEAEAAGDLRGAGAGAHHFDEFADELQEEHGQ
jgi:hypothetical protein